MPSIGSIWNAENISTESGQTVVLNVLLYNSETWMLKETTKNKLRVFLMKTGRNGTNIVEACRLAAPDRDE